MNGDITNRRFFSCVFTSPLGRLCWEGGYHLFQNIKHQKCCFSHFPLYLLGTVVQTFRLVSCIFSHKELALTEKGILRGILFCNITNSTPTLPLTNVHLSEVLADNCLITLLACNMITGVTLCNTVHTFMRSC